jgi:hypothetical protein
MMRFDLMFLIRAGKVLYVSIGPAYMFRSEQYVNDVDGGSPLTYEDIYDIDYRIISIEPGLNFVKRFYPLKINAGLMVGVNLLLGKSRYEYNTYYGETEVERYLAVGYSFGGRGGVELLAGPHVGFNIDFLYRYCRFSFDQDDAHHFAQVFTSDTITDPEAKVTVVLPSIGLCVGINFYF